MMLFFIIPVTVFRTSLSPEFERSFRVVLDLLAISGVWLAVLFGSKTKTYNGEQKKLSGVRRPVHFTIKM
jgi:hypothetical protein